MAKVLVTESYLTNIADAIRSKNGTSDTYTPAEMSSAISDLSVGGAASSGSVNVEPTLQSKSVTPTESQQTITADSGYDGLSSVSVGAISSTYVGSGITRSSGSTITPSSSQQTVSVNGKLMTGDITVNAIPSSYVQPNGSLNITSNDTYDVTNYASAVVNVAGSSATVATATATPSSNSTSISFSISGEPKMFAVQINKNASYISGSSSRYITSVICNGSTVYTTCLYKSGSTAREYNYSTSSFTYSNGALTITSAGSSTSGYFMSGTAYRLIYIY